MEENNYSNNFIEQLKLHIALPIRHNFNINHAFFEEGDAFLRSHCAKEKTFDIDEEVFLHKTLGRFDCHIGGCIQQFTNIQDYEKHYNSAHRHSCHECKRRFPNNRLLEIHIQESHDTLFQVLAEKQNMYECHIESCHETFKDAAQRNKHMIKAHQWPSDFRYGHLKKKKTPVLSKMEVVTGSCQQDQMMETQTKEDTSTEMATPDGVKVRHPIKFAPKVPNHICFGHGVNKGFTRPSKSKKRHWHQRNAEGIDTSVNIEKITFEDMQDALP